MIKNIEHIAIFAADPKALVDWYCEHCEHLGAADKDRAPATFEEAGLRHLAFTVESYDEFERLAAAGIEF